MTLDNNSVPLGNINKISKSAFVKILISSGNFSMVNNYTIFDNDFDIMNDPPDILILDLTLDEKSTIDLANKLFSESNVKWLVCSINKAEAFKEKAEENCSFLQEVSNLSNREVEVIQLCAKGLQYKEIAYHLGISFETVKKHMRNIYKKLEVQNKVEAINKFKNNLFH